MNSIYKTEPKKKKGFTVVFVGPSASGKTEIVKRLVENNDLFRKVVTATTRKPRPGERHGVDYFFLSPENFEEERKRGNIIEETEYAGARYGTLASEFERIHEAGKVALLILDMNGVRALKNYYGEENVASIFVFRHPKEIEEELKKRPVDRKEIDERIRLAREEIGNIAECDEVIYNTKEIHHVVIEAEEKVMAAYLHWDLLFNEK